MTRWYAICGPGLKTVTTNWKKVEELAKIYPYCSYRRFYTEEDARHFAESHKRAYDSISVSKYGNTFEKFFIGMSYIIDKDVVYYSYDKSRVGNIRLVIPENIPVKYTAKAALVKIHYEKHLDKQLVADNMKAIVDGVKMLGAFVDVDITVPNHWVTTSIKSTLTF